MKTQVNGQPANVSQDRNIMNVVDCGKSVSLTVVVVVCSFLVLDLKLVINVLVCTVIV